MRMLLVKRLDCLESAVYAAFQHLCGDGTTAEDHGIQESGILKAAMQSPKRVRRKVSVAGQDKMGRKIFRVRQSQTSIQ